MLYLLVCLNLAVSLYLIYRWHNDSPKPWENRVCENCRANAASVEVEALYRLGMERMRDAAAGQHPRFPPPDVR